MDTGGIDPEHGGKSLLSVGSSDFIDDIKVQALAAIRDADAILLVTDGDSGITEPDREVAELLRRRQRKGPDGKFKPPIFVAVNKSESEQRRASASEFYELGLGEPYPISAIHGTDVGDLLDALVSSFPEAEGEEDTPSRLRSSVSRIQGNRVCSTSLPGRSAPSSARSRARRGMRWIPSLRWMGCPLL